MATLDNPGPRCLGETSSANMPDNKEGYVVHWDTSRSPKDKFAHYETVFLAT